MSKNIRNLSTERFVRLLLNHPKGQEAIEYFISRSIPIYKCLEGINGLDSTFPLKVIMKTQEYLYKKHLNKIGNNDRITGLTKNQTDEIYSIFAEIAKRYKSVALMTKTEYALY